MATMQQVTLSLTPELIAFVEREAELESRSIAGQIRHLVVQAARRAGAPTAPAWPVRPQVNAPEEIAAAEARLAEHEREITRLASIKGIDRMPADDDRLRALRDEVVTLGKEIEMAKRMGRSG
jgi:hypothetical protein